MSASYLQTSFLGGQWSPTAQGRADEEAYRTALNVSFNALPVEAGAHTRRPGTTAPSTTRKGRPGVVREFHFSQASPYNFEFTDGIIRLWAGAALATVFPHTITSVSNANPAVISVPTVGADWVVGSTIEMALTPIPGVSPAGVAILFNRQFELGAGADGTHFTLLDPVTGAGIDGATLNLAGWTILGAKVLEFVTPYTFGTAWKTTQVRVVQDEDIAFVLVPGFQPATLQNTGTSTAPVFAWTPPGSVVFTDGPYLDPPTDASTLTPSGVSGSITLTASSAASINAGAGFQSTDVGRFVRLFSEPLDWSSGTAYVAGNQVRFETGAGPAYYQAIVANTAVQPDTDNGTNWAITTTAAAWSWAIITAVANTTHATATLQASRTDRFQQPLAGGSLKYANPVKVWRLGSWSGTTGYPTAGGFHDGRFWFAGSVKNRFETTMSQENFDFAPTLLDGTVADNNGVTETLKSTDENSIFWFAANAEGMVMGTQGGEWLVEASTLGESITPTSVTAKRVTKYGCANVEPRSTGLSWVFVQRYNKQVYEYLADVYSRKWSGTNIARRARNLTAPGIVEIAYTFENVPCLWARTALDQLVGCTYKRSSPFAVQTPADFNAWHYHTLGSNRAVHSISSGPSPDGTVDTVTMVTYDAVTGIHYVEFLTPVFEETGTLTQAWFLDGAISPTYGVVSGTGGPGTTVTFYGLNYLVGGTVTAWIAGIDAGDFVVTAAGSITVPLDGTASALLTLAELETVATQGGFGQLGVSILINGPSGGLVTPNNAGLVYTFTNAANASYANGFVDFDRNICFFDAGAPVSGDSSTNGHTLHAFNMTTRAELWTAAPGEFAYAPLVNSSALGDDGHLYYATIDAAHLWGRFNTTTKAIDIDLADGGSASPGYITTMTSAGNTFIFSCGLGAGAVSAQWVIVNMTGASPGVVSRGVFDENIGSIGTGNAFPCRGPAGSAYALVHNADGSVLGLYRAVADSLISGGIGKVGTVTPAHVHAGLTSLSLQPGQLLYDETDGNILAVFTGSDAALYLVKISTQDASIMWSTVVNGVGDFWRSRVRFGMFSFFGALSGGHYTLYQINTATGAIVTSAPTGGSFTSGWTMHDDKLGFMVFNIASNGANEWATFGPSAQTPAPTPALVDTAPAVIGFNYISRGQILRPIAAQEVQDPTGPALGKTRRSHMYAALFVNTQGVKVGTDFTKMRLANLVSPGRTQTLAKNVLFTDVIQATLEDTASFHSMWAWQTDRPYPTTVSSVELFVNESPR